MKKSIRDQIRQKKGGMTIEEIKEREEQRKYAKKIKRDRFKTTNKVKGYQYDRWAEMSGLEPHIDSTGKITYDYEKIDWDNPVIELEQFLCDWGTLVGLGMGGKHRAKELEKISMQQQEIYWHPEQQKKYLPQNMEWNVGETKYTDLSMTPMDTMRGIKNAFIGGKKKDE